MNTAAFSERFPRFTAGVGAKHLPDVLPLLTRRTLAAGEAASQQDQTGGALVLVESGEAEVSVHRDGRDWVVGHIGPGGVFGEVSLADGGTHSATVTARSPMSVLVLERATLAALRRDAPAAAAAIQRALCHTLADRVREKSDQVEATATGGVASVPRGALASLAALLFSNGA